MTLLFITLPGDNGHEVLWPWEQDATLHRALLSHTASPSCSRCLLAKSAVFGTEVPKVTFTPGCNVGVELAHALRSHAATLRAKK